jgi:RNA polymerase sigma-70 factor (ECF subfamily)
MDDQQWLAERFNEQRHRLRAVAYRMLGSLSEADDAVQEAWLRLSRADTSDVENLDGWLTTVVARVSLNMLRSRRSLREEPLGPRMPEPIIDRADGADPEHQALLADSVGLALLVVLETLTPAERLASGRSWPPPAAVTSRRWSPSSIRTWCCGPTPGPCSRAYRVWSAARGRSQARR